MKLATFCLFKFSLNFSLSHSQFKSFLYSSSYCCSCNFLSSALYSKENLLYPHLILSDLFSSCKMLFSTSLKFKNSFLNFNLLNSLFLFLRYDFLILLKFLLFLNISRIINLFVFLLRFFKLSSRSLFSNFCLNFPSQTGCFAIALFFNLFFFLAFILYEEDFFKLRYFLFFKRFCFLGFLGGFPSTLLTFLTCLFLFIFCLLFTLFFNFTTFLSEITFLFSISSLELFFNFSKCLTPPISFLIFGFNFFNFLFSLLFLISLKIFSFLFFLSLNFKPPSFSKLIFLLLLPTSLKTPFLPNFLLFLILLFFVSFSLLGLNFFNFFLIFLFLENFSFFLFLSLNFKLLSFLESTFNLLLPSSAKTHFFADFLFSPTLSLSILSFAVLEIPPLYLFLSSPFDFFLLSKFFNFDLAILLGATFFTSLIFFLFFSTVFPYFSSSPPAFDSTDSELFSSDCIKTNLLSLSFAVAM